jgi:hypothetical protein
VGRRELLLVFLVGCNSDFDGAREEGRYAAADAPDAKIDRGFPEPIPNAQADATPDAEVDGGVDSAKFDAGTCIRDESRDNECVVVADAGWSRAVACPANEAGNPSTPPASDCLYTGWADAGSLTMCCK